MGGFNSGRNGGKNCTTDMRPLDVRRLQRSDCLRPGLSFDWSWTRGGKTTATIHIHIDSRHNAALTYRSRAYGGEWVDRAYSVGLTWTDCHYGGQRAWWRCPALGCGRRVAVLYGGSIYACRRCHQLAYKSQRETADDRATRRANKLRERLGWEAGILNGEGGKPKGMHWATFERLKARHDVAVYRSLQGLADRLGLLDGRLQGINARVDVLGF
jgi:hypothetical protein